MSAYRYIGDGFAYAVPARDITADEFDALDGRQRRIVLHSGWYEPVKATAKPADEKKADVAKSDGKGE